jgi:ABC-type phosphate transport system permease subunit
LVRGYGLSQIAVRARARHKVEKVMLGSLFFASTLAIVTTVGIVLSMLFQTITFFGQVSPWNFFFGTVWDPRFAAAGSGGSEGQFGLIPLLAGTLYIAFVALLVAVPVGLMSAVYMSEYASKPVRSIVKPALELLAGIPTIVYGIFALVTLGPWLRDLSAMRLQRLALHPGAVDFHRRPGHGRHAHTRGFVACPTTSSTRCRKRCATARWGSARRARKRSSKRHPAGGTSGHRRRGASDRLARHR